MKQLEYLQNAADELGLTVHLKQFDDKRKRIPMFFLQDGSATVSPVLDYKNLNHFILGWAKCKKQLLKKDSVASS